MAASSSATWVDSGLAAGAGAGGGAASPGAGSGPALSEARATQLRCGSCPARGSKAEQRSSARRRVLLRGWLACGSHCGRHSSSAACSWGLPQGPASMAANPRHASRRCPATAAAAADAAARELPPPVLAAAACWMPSASRPTMVTPARLLCSMTSPTRRAAADSTCNTMGQVAVLPRRVGWDPIPGPAPNTGQAPTSTQRRAWPFCLGSLTSPSTSASAWAAAACARRSSAATKGRDRMAAGRGRRRGTHRPWTCCSRSTKGAPLPASQAIHRSPPT